MSKFFFKKKLGQNFLIDNNIAKKIVKSISFYNSTFVVEVGPGMGILTKYIIKHTSNIFLIEIDKKFVHYLLKKFPSLHNCIIQENFLKWKPLFSSFTLIGNFPYNISSQILFRILKYFNFIPECVGMFQKEVAKRIIAKSGNKIYGILSVLIQTFYKVEYLFTVNENVFLPKPKVKSSVIRLRRRSNIPKLNKNIFFKFVKTAFNQRRKILRNSLKSLKLSNSFYKMSILNKRAEQISIKEFIELSKKL